MTIPKNDKTRNAGLGSSLNVGVGDDRKFAGARSTSIRAFMNHRKANKWRLVVRPILRSGRNGLSYEGDEGEICSTCRVLTVNVPTPPRPKRVRACGSDALFAPVDGKRTTFEPHSEFISVLSPEAE
jgi:hypothetical protein